MFGGGCIGRGPLSPFLLHTRKKKKTARTPAGFFFAEREERPSIHTLLHTRKGSHLTADSNLPHYPHPHRKKIYVKSLRAQESLACVDVVLTDKTGTLTENRLALAAVLLPSSVVGPTASAYLDNDGACVRACVRACVGAFSSSSTIPARM